MINRILKQTEKNLYTEEFELMNFVSEYMIKRKIEPSLIQHAHILQFLMKNANNNEKILCVGSFEDIVSDTLTKIGWNIINIDPHDNMDLATYKLNNQDEEFNFIFSTSVIEHVDDDETFIDDIKSLLSKNGVAILTCDFKPDWSIGDPVPETSNRFYTKDRLEFFIGKYSLLPIDRPNWNINIEDLDFTWDNINYTFACLAFRKGN